MSLIQILMLCHIPDFISEGNQSVNIVGLDNPVGSWLDDDPRLKPCTTKHDGILYRGVTLDNRLCI